MKKLRHKCKIILSLFVTLLLVVVSVNASLAEGENSNVKTLSTTLSENNITLTFSAIVDASIPEDTTLNVKKVIDTDSSYKDLETKLNDQADKDHYINTAFSLYDYTFTSNNQEVTPSGDVTITMAYNQAYAPASITNDDELALMRLSDPIVNFTKDEQTKISFADQSNKVNQVIYKTSSHDPIALAWREKKQSVNSIKVHYVNAKDTSKDLATKTLSASELNGTIDLNTLSKALENTDTTTYTYQKTTLDAASGTTIVGAKAEKVNGLTKLYYIPQGSADYTPYKGEGESYDVNLYMLYNVEEAKDTSDQLDTADQLKTETKDSADQSETKTESNSQSTTTQSSIADTKTKEKDTADQLTTQTDTKDTADQLTSSSTDTADQTKASDTADQVKENTSSTTPSKKSLKRTVLRAAPAADYKTGTLKIVDKFADSGRIEASYSDNIPDSATNIKYTWYRTKDGQESEVTRKNTAGSYNIHYDESQASYLDLSADEGDQTWTKSDNISYKVVLSFTYNGKDYSIESGQWNLRYFGQLENGSFENPVISGTTKYNWPGNYSTNNSTGYAANYPTGDENAPTGEVQGYEYEDGGHYSADTIWKTTSDWRYRYGEQIPGTDIEIVNTRAGSGYMDAYRMRYSNNSGAKDGKQFAELNAESAGALYQDVITHPGQPMSYWLSHQARTKYDDSYRRGQYANSMYLVIAPLKDVKNIKTQEELVTFINNHGGYSGTISRYADNDDYLTYNQNGILIRKIVSDNNGWHDISYENGYTPTSSATRFFFVAAGTADTDKTVGNFLDRVGFSQKLPEPSQDQFNLQVSKTITGLTGEQIADLAKGKDHALTLTLTNYSGNASYESLNGLKLQFTATKTSDGYKLMPVSVKGNEVNNVGNEVLVKSDEKKSITLNWTFANKEIDRKTYKFKVTESDPKLDGYQVTTTNSVENQEGSEPLVTKEIDVKASSNVAFKFSNLYEKESNLTLTKHVTGNQADLTKVFKFNVTIKNVSQNKTFKINKDNAESTNPTSVTSDDQGTFTTSLYLKNGQSIRIEGLALANEDASYEITEENGNYQTSYQIDGSSSTSGAATGEKKFDNEDHTIAFTNTKNGEIPTGTQKNPLITIPLIIAGIGFVLYILKTKNEVE